MRAATVLLLASTAAILCCGRLNGQSGVYLDNALANRVLDSLESREAWERAYRIRTAQLAVEMDRHRDTEAQRRQDSAYCDSAHWAEVNEVRVVQAENDELRSDARSVPWLVALTALVSILATLALQ